MVKKRKNKLIKIFFVFIICFIIFSGALIVFNNKEKINFQKFFYKPVKLNLENESSVTAITNSQSITGDDISIIDTKTVDSNCYDTIYYDKPASQNKFDALFPLYESITQDETSSPVDDKQKEIDYNQFLIDLYKDSTGIYNSRIELLQLQKITEQFKLDLMNEVTFNDATKKEIKSITDFINDPKTSNDGKNLAYELLASVYFSSGINKAYLEFPNDFITIKLEDKVIPNYMSSSVIERTPIKLKIEIKKQLDDKGKITGIKKVITQFSARVPPYKWIDICKSNSLLNDPTCSNVVGKDEYAVIFDAICKKGGDLSIIESLLATHKLLKITEENGLEDSSSYQSMMSDFNSAIEQLENIKNQAGNLNNPAKIDIKLAEYSAILGNYKSALYNYTAAYIADGLVSKNKLTNQEKSFVLMNIALFKRTDDSEPHALEKSLQYINEAIKVDPKNERAKKIKRDLQIEILKIIAISLKERSESEVTNVITDTGGSADGTIINYISRYISGASRASGVSAKPEDLLKEGQLLSDESENQYAAIMFMIRALNREYFLEDFYGDTSNDDLSNPDKLAATTKKIKTIVKRILTENSLPVEKTDYWTTIILNFLQKNPDVALASGGGTKDGAIQVMKRIGFDSYKTYYFTNIRWVGSLYSMKKRVTTIEYNDVTPENFATEYFIFTDIQPSNKFYKYNGITSTWGDYLLKQVNLVTVEEFLLYAIPFSRVSSVYAPTVNAINGVESGTITVAEWTTIKSPVLRMFAEDVVAFRTATIGRMTSSILTKYPEYPIFASFSGVGTELAFFWGSSYVVDKVFGSYVGLPWNLFFGMVLLPSAHITKGAIYTGKLVESQNTIIKFLTDAGIKDNSYKLSAFLRNDLAQGPMSNVVIQVALPADSPEVLALDSALSKRYSKVNSDPLPLKSDLVTRVNQYRIDGDKMINLFTLKGSTPAIDVVDMGKVQGLLTQTKDLKKSLPNIEGDDASDKFIVDSQKSLTSSDINDNLKEQGLNLPNNDLMTIKKPENIITPPANTQPSCCIPDAKVFDSKIIVNGFLDLEKSGKYWIVVTDEGDLLIYDNPQKFFKDYEGKKAYAYGEADIAKVSETDPNSLYEIKSLAIPEEFSQGEIDFMSDSINRALKDRGYSGKEVVTVARTNKNIKLYGADYNSGESYYVDSDGNIEVATKDKIEPFDPELHRKVFNNGHETKVIHSSDGKTWSIFDGIQDSDSLLTLVEDNGKYFVYSNDPGAMPEVFDPAKHPRVYADESYGAAKIYIDSESEFVSGDIFDNLMKDVGLLDNQDSGILYADNDIQYFLQNGITRKINPITDPTIIYNSKTGEGFVLRNGKYEALACYDPKKQLGLFFENGEAYVTNPWSRSGPLLYAESSSGDIYNPVTGEVYFVETSPETGGQTWVIEGKLKSKNGEIPWVNVGNNGKTKYEVYIPEDHSSHELTLQDPASFKDDNTGFKMVHVRTSNVDIGPGLEYCGPETPNPLLNSGMLNRYFKSKYGRHENGGAYSPSPEGVPSDRIVEKGSYALKVKQIEDLSKLVKIDGWTRSKGNDFPVFTKTFDDGSIETIQIYVPEGKNYPIIVPVKRVKYFDNIEDLRKFLIDNQDKYEIITGDKADIISNGEIFGARVRELASLPDNVITYGSLDIHIPISQDIDFRIVGGGGKASEPIPEEQYREVPELPKSGNIIDFELPLLKSADSISISRDIYSDSITGINIGEGETDLRIIDPKKEGTRLTLEIQVENEQGVLETLNQIPVVTTIENNEPHLYDLQTGEPLVIMPEDGYFGKLAVIEPESPDLIEALISDNGDDILLPKNSRIVVKDSNGNPIYQQIFIDPNTQTAIPTGISETTPDYSVDINIANTNERLEQLFSQGYRIAAYVSHPGNLNEISLLKPSTGEIYDLEVNADPSNLYPIIYDFLQRSEDLISPWKGRDPIQALGSGNWKVEYLDNDIAIAADSNGNKKAVIPSLNEFNQRVLDGNVIGYDNLKKQLVANRGNGEGCYYISNIPKGSVIPRWSIFSSPNLGPTIFWDIVKEELILRNKETGLISKAKPFFRTTDNRLFFDYDDDRWTYVLGSRQIENYGSTPANAVSRIGRIFLSSDEKTLLLNVNSRFTTTDLRTIDVGLITNHLGNKVTFFYYPKIQDDPFSEKPMVFIEGMNHPIQYSSALSSQKFPYKLFDLKNKKIFIYYSDGTSDLINFEFLSNNVILYFGKNPKTKIERWRIFSINREVGETHTAVDYNPKIHGEVFTDSDGNIRKWNPGINNGVGGFDIIEDSNLDLSYPTIGSQTKRYFKSPRVKAKPISNSYTSEKAITDFIGVNPEKAKVENINDPISGDKIDTGYSVKFFKTGGTFGQPVEFWARKKTLITPTMGDGRNELVLRSYLKFLNDQIGFRIKSPDAYLYSSSSGNVYLIYHPLIYARPLDTTSNIEPFDQILQKYPDAIVASEIRADMILGALLCGFDDSKPDAMLIPTKGNIDFMWMLDLEDIRKLDTTSPQGLARVINNIEPTLSKKSKMNQNDVDLLLQRADKILAMDDDDFYLESRSWVEKAGYRENQIEEIHTKLLENREFLKENLINLLTQLQIYGFVDSRVNIPAYESRNPYSIIPKTPVSDVLNMNDANRRIEAARVFGESYLSSQSEIPLKTNWDILLEAHNMPNDNLQDKQNKFDFLANNLKPLRGEKYPLTEVREAMTRGICGASTMLDYKLNYWNNPDFIEVSGVKYRQGDMVPLRRDLYLTWRAKDILTDIEKQKKVLSSLGMLDSNGDLTKALENFNIVRGPLIRKELEDDGITDLSELGQIIMSQWSHGGGDFIGGKDSLAISTSAAKCNICPDTLTNIVIKMEIPAENIVPVPKFEAGKPVPPLWNINNPNRLTVEDAITRNLFFQHPDAVLSPECSANPEIEVTAVGYIPKKFVNSIRNTGN